MFKKFGIIYLMTNIVIIKLYGYIYSIVLRTNFYTAYFLPQGDVPWRKSKKSLT